MKDITTDQPLSKLSVVLVDPDLYGVRDLQRYVTNREDMELIQAFKTGRGALNFFKHDQADLLIINPALPDANGFDLITSLMEPPAIIVVADRPDYAYFAFRVRAVDYLLKPVSHPDLDLAMERVRLLMALEKELAASREHRPADIS